MRCAGASARFPAPLAPGEFLTLARVRLGGPRDREVMTCNPPHAKLVFCLVVLTTNIPWRIVSGVSHTSFL